MAVLFPGTTLVPEDPTWGARSAPFTRRREMPEITTQEAEFTSEGTLLEVLRVVDVRTRSYLSGSASASG